jgi:hypothetical protein
MSAPHDVSTESPSRPRSRWGCLVGCVATLGLLSLGAFLYLTDRGERALRDAVAEADAQDPDWRLADLEAKRVRPPDKDNAALQALAARRLMPQGWGNAPEYTELFQELPPEAQLNEPQVRALKAELGKADKARDEARKLADMPDGYFVINWSPDVLSTSMQDLQEMRAVANLLKDDALLRAQEKDADGAVRSLQAAVNAGRSIGDVPGAIGQLVRMACVAVGVQNLERVLAQGEPSAAALAEVQHLLEEEDRYGYLLVTARGERAGSDQFMGWLESGKASGTNARQAIGGGDARINVILNVPGEAKREHAAMIRYMNRVVEAAGLPEPQRKKWFDELDAAARNEPPLVALLAPAMNKLAAADQRQHAFLRCAIVMLAAERYRQKHNRWPETVQALADDGYLKAVPVDPYDGAPIRMKRVPDGLVIYAVGPDGQDNGGNLDRKMTFPAGTDLGLRLWDVAKRRQPPLPPKAAPPSGMPGGPQPGEPGRVEGP